MQKNYSDELKDLFMTVAREQASDLHINAGRYPTLRIAGELIPLTKKPVLTPADAEGLVFGMLSEDDRKKLIEEKELDFSYNFEKT